MQLVKPANVNRNGVGLVVNGMPRFFPRSTRNIHFNRKFVINNASAESSKSFIKSKGTSTLRPSAKLLSKQMNFEKPVKARRIATISCRYLLPGPFFVTILNYTREYIFLSETVYVIIVPIHLLFLGVQLLYGLKFIILSYHYIVSKQKN